MEAHDELSLEETCLTSYVPHKSEIPKKCFNDIKDLHFDGMDGRYTNISMTRLQGSKYLMLKSSRSLFCVVTSTLKAERVLEFHKAINFFTDGEYVLLVNIYRPISVHIMRHSQEIGEISFNCKIRSCKNGKPIFNRYEQQVGQTIYSVDKYGDMHRIEWQDIRNGKYCKIWMKPNVDNFFVDKTGGFATIDMNHTLFLHRNYLSLNSELTVDLRTKVDLLASNWTVLACVAKCWMVSGDFYGQAIMASISNEGKIRSTMKLKLTSSGYRVMYSDIYSIKKASVRGMRGIMIAIEREGCCHLISIVYGRMSVLQSIDLIVPDVFEYKYHRLVMNVTATGTKGKFIVGGFDWTKMITINLNSLA